MPRCRYCSSQYKPARPMQPGRVCNDHECQIRYALEVTEKKRAQKATAERKEARQKLEGMKSLAKLAKDAEVYVNRYVRLRDRNEGCISCDKPANWPGQWHASHYKSVGANSFLRFHLWNIHKACSECNNYLSGNIHEYSKRLPGRIGQEKFNFLLSAPREKKYTRDYLVRLKKVAMLKCRRLEKRIKSESHN